MYVGEFLIKALWIFLYFSIVVGTCFIINKVLKIIKDDLEYKRSAKRDLNEVDDYIKKDNLY